MNDRSSNSKQKETEEEKVFLSRDAMKPLEVSQYTQSCRVFVHSLFHKRREISVATLFKDADVTVRMELPKTCHCFQSV